MRPVWLILGGVGVGFLAVLGVGALVLAQDGSDPPDGREVALSFPAIDHDPAAAQDLIDAWRRWRTATFVSSGTWSRALDGSGPALEGDTYTAQDPPRRLVIRLGVVVEEVEDGVVTCDAPTEELIVPGCTETRAARTYAERVEAEMALVEGYVIGETRIYDVATVDGCFRVELLATVLRSPWGRAAEFCFEAESGALQSSRVRRQSAMDVESTTVIRTDVTDADF